MTTSAQTSTCLALMRLMVLWAENVVEAQLVAATLGRGNRTKYDYDLWGARTDIGGTAPGIDIGYTGRWHDSNGLIDHRDRLRSARSGVWLQPDRLRVAANRYLYAKHSPALFSDPSGRDPLLEATATFAFDSAFDAAMQYFDIAFDWDDPFTKEVVEAIVAYAAFLLTLAIVALALSGTAKCNRVTPSKAFTAEESDVLRRTFGVSNKGIDEALRQVPPKFPKELTKDVALRYRALAQRVIDEGRDTIGVQAKRIQYIDKILPLLKG